MYHTAVYQAAAASAGAANVDMAAAVDSVFTQRNGHYTFTVPLKLGRAFMLGASLTAGRWQCPTWNAIGEFDIQTVNRAATVPSNPQYEDYLDYKPQFPINEEFQVQASNNLGSSTEVESAVIQILSDDWTPQIPQGQLGVGRLKTIMTSTITPVVGAWSGPENLALVSQLRNGVFAVVGMVIQGAGILAARMIFPTQRPFKGRFFRPGVVAQRAVGDLIGNQLGSDRTDLGVLGLFHTFELPQVEVFGLAANSVTYTLFLDLIYLGTDLSQLTNWASGGSFQATI